MKELYILYDCKSRVILYSTYNKDKLFKYASDLIDDETFKGEVHIIKINLEGVERWKK